MIRLVSDHFVDEDVIIVVQPSNSYKKELLQTIIIPTTITSFADGNYCKPGEKVKNRRCFLRCYTSPYNWAKGQAECDSVITDELFTIDRNFKLDFGNFPGHELSNAEGGWCGASIREHNADVINSVTPIRRVDLVSSILCMEQLELSPEASIPTESSSSPFYPAPKKPMLDKN